MFRIQSSRDSIDRPESQKHQKFSEPRIARMTRMGRTEFLVLPIAIMAAHSRNSRLRFCAGLPQYGSCCLYNSPAVWINLSGKS